MKWSLIRITVVRFGFISRKFWKFLLHPIFGAEFLNQKKFAVENLAIFCIRFAPNHRYIIGTSQSGHVNYFDPKDGTIIDRILGHSDAANQVTFLDDNQFFTNSDDSTIALWDARNKQKPIKRLVGHTDWVKNVTLMDKWTVLTAGFDSKLIVWDLKTSVVDLGINSGKLSSRLTLWVINYESFDYETCQESDHSRK